MNGRGRCRGDSGLEMEDPENEMVILMWHNQVGGLFHQFMLIECIVYANISILKTHFDISK